MFVSRTTLRTRLVVVIAAAALGAAGCSTEEEMTGSAPPPPDTTLVAEHQGDHAAAAPEAGAPTGEEVFPTEPSGEPLELQPQRTYEQQLPELIGYVDQYWASNQQGYVSPQLFPAYENNTMACGGKPLPLKNAFSCGNLITWDETNLFRPMYADPSGGDMGVAVVLAHEWGHYIQTFRGMNLKFAVHRELLSDCLAGSWAGDMQRRGLLEDGDLEQATTTLFSLGDDAGGKIPVDWRNQNAHGHGKQREAFFNYGMEQGPEPCVALLTQYDNEAV